MKIFVFLLLILPAFSFANEVDDETYYGELHEDLVNSLELPNSTLDSRFSDDHIFFGPEFTFWVVPEAGENGSILRDPSTISQTTKALEKYYKHLSRHLITNQPYELKFEKEIYHNSDHSINAAEYFSQFGWSFQIQEDVGVIEVTMKPMTADQFDENADAIQDAIFTSAENIGHPPALYGGGGHINMSLGYLKKNPLLLRNFVVDLLNHNELFLGIFGFDTNNALSPSLLTNKVWEEIRAGLDFVDSYGYEYDAVEQFVLELQQILINVKDPFLDFWHSDWKNRKKYNAFRFKRTFNKDQQPNGLGDRIELRAVRPQNDIYVWNRQIRLLEKRVQYLESLDRPLKLKPKVSVERIDKLPEDNEMAKERALTPPVNPQQALKAFHQYVTESGENWEDHQDYLWPAWHSDGEVNEFNRRLCARLFEATS